jgi:hypothetical protein
MHCHVGPFKSVEAPMQAPWVWEVQIPAVLWTEYGFVPNAAIAAPKFYNGEISTCRNCRGEGECQKGQLQKIVASLSAPCTDLSRKYSRE